MLCIFLNGDLVDYYKRQLFEVTPSLKLLHCVLQYLSIYFFWKKTIHRWKTSISTWILYLLLFYFQHKYQTCNFSRNAWQHVNKSYPQTFYNTSINTSSTLLLFSILNTIINILPLWTIYNMVVVENVVFPVVLAVLFPQGPEPSGAPAVSVPARGGAEWPRRERGAPARASLPPPAARCTCRSLSLSFSTPPRGFLLCLCDM